MGSDASWSRVRALFERAVALDLEQRRAFLSELDPDEAELRREVEALLSAATRDDAFLEPPLTGVPGLTGRRVGAFRVVRLLASGGMGSVWEAEQEEPRRKVALKTMRSGLASSHSRRRFRFESELLAGLRHPAIAQVYDAGVLDAGGGSPSLPWFALEFVEGARTLTAYAREERLDLAARLRLFQRVCNAVQHAHQRGVVHRDLKAANLLVDREGHVKVIDFGVARLVGDGAGGQGRGHTLAGEIVGTLESMSPEQVDGRQQEVDARTDVYALGATLYELTTGRPPHRLEGLSLAEAARRIREVEPTPPTRLDPALPREVDWIVATAMAKEPERRYAAASELEHDIERLLAREPVLAGPPSRTYRLRKFCERHRAGVAATVVGLLALALGLGGALFGVVNEQRARNARASARAEADLTERFAGFFVDLFEGAMPERTDGRELSTREILGRGTRWIRAELVDRPLVQARLLRSVGNVYNGFAQYPEARSALEDAVRLAREQGPAGELDLAWGLVRLGQVHRRLDEPAAAERAYREALAILERELGPDSAELGPTLNELGQLLGPTRPEEALGFYRRAYELVVREHGEDHGDAGILLANVGGLELAAHRYADARGSLERALVLVERHHGEGDPRTARLLGLLARACKGLGEYERALELELRDLELTARALGPDHPDIGMVSLDLARTAEALGDEALALEQAERAAEVLARRLAPEHPHLMAARSARARVLIRARRYGDARAAMQGVLALRPDSDHGALAQHAAALVLAQVERLEGHLDAALELLERVLADPGTETNPKLRADALWERAYVLLLRGDEEAARAERARALVTPPPDQPGAISHACADAKFGVLSGDPARALGLLGEALERGYLPATVLTDPDFDALRAEPGYEPIAAGLRGPPAE